MSPSATDPRPLLVCYVPGLDARRIGPGVTPRIHELRLARPVVEIATLPNTELLPTMVTGVWPHDHRIWQVSLRPAARRPGRPRPADLVPDLVSTTLQCVRHFFDRDYDLAAVPHRRRRRFELHRFKYTRRAKSDSVMGRFGRFDSVFGVLGSASHYRFTKDLDSLDGLAAELPSGGRALEFLEMYALDLTQHWHLDDPARMDEVYGRADAFVGRLRERCAERGSRLLLLVDHGQERVVGTIPLTAALADAGVPDREFSYFIEVGLARFWFHTERARRAIGDRLQALEHTTLLDRREMARFNVAFDDDSFGELYLAADAGRVFFPHDFYQPLANLFLGLTDRHQRRRILDPVHRGNHGYLPHHPSERGYMVLDDDLAPTATEAELVDVAPTLLSLVGRKPAPHMTGRVLFHP